MKTCYEKALVGNKTKSKEKISKKVLYHDDEDDLEEEDRVKNKKK